VVAVSRLAFGMKNKQANIFSSDTDITGQDVGFTFSTDDEHFGETTTIDLKPDGRNIEVTEENKKEYVQ
jgi:E3 ubiquitin-protein ligase NEDD4